MQDRDFQPGFPGSLEPTTFQGIDPDGSTRTSTGLAFVPDPLPPAFDPVPMIGSLFGLLDDMKTSLLRLESFIDSLPGRTVLLAAMRIREAQASSRIENTRASVKEIALAGLEDKPAESEPLEVFRNRRAIEAGMRSNLPICGRLIKDMHRILIADPNKRPGQFRDIQVAIGAESPSFEKCRFVPPPPSRVQECFEAWERFCNPVSEGPGTRKRWPYFVELAMAHYQFETIHPFSEGNGRLGRAIVTLAPVKDGVLRHPVCNLSEFVYSQRQEYYDRLLRVSTHGEWESWIEYFCSAIAQQARADQARAERLGRLYEKYAAQITTRRSSILATKLLNHLFEHQVVTIPLAAKIMGVTYAAAQRHVEAFLRLGIISIHREEYGKIYIASAIIRAIKGQGED